MTTAGVPNQERYQDLDDAALIQLVTQRDEDALSQLYDRHYRLVFDVAVSVVHDPALAEDVLLDVFYTVWQKADTYQPGRSRVTTWLVSIGRNRAIDALRRLGARAEGHSVNWDSVPALQTPARDGPERAAEREIRRGSLHAALAQLPVEQKEVLALAFLQGYTHREIAERLQLPLGTVKTRVRLGMQKLRETLVGLA